MKAYASVWAGLAAISFIWGSTWLAIKIGLESISPLTGLAFRFLLAAAILGVTLRIRRIAIPLYREAMIVYLALTLFTFSIPFTLVYWAQQYIPSGLSSILFAVFPFWVAVFSHLMLPKERLTLAKVGGIVIGFSGLLFIFSGDVHWTDPKGFSAMLLLLLSTILQAGSTVTVRKFAGPLSPFAMNFVGMSAAGGILLALALMLESPSAMTWDARAVGSILYLALFGSVVAFVTYHWLLKRIEAVYISLTSFVNPIIAVILGALVLGERLAPSVFAGAALVLAGVLVTNAPSLRARIASREM